ncbi:hypothetical protein QJS04_geneDACA023627 [Acorus gramineus]|uniref:Non-specific serine/threonine protein kinase n=1 Tax=Acorus gramineus TaxID=55184 RepID=A0AAV8ZY00_ACOGR|nr:hypothetical protein QJS04_geneDACA023627 [Acorus gramineus]
MSSLKILNISNNQLSGSIPLALLKKMNNQELSLRYDLLSLILLRVFYFLVHVNYMI